MPSHVPADFQNDYGYYAMITLLITHQCLKIIGLLRLLRINAPAHMREVKKQQDKNVLTRAYIPIRNNRNNRNNHIILVT